MSRSAVVWISAVITEHPFTDKIMQTSLDMPPLTFGDMNQDDIRKAFGEMAETLIEKMRNA